MFILFSFLKSFKTFNFFLNRHRRTLYKLLWFEESNNMTLCISLPEIELKLIPNAGCICGRYLITLALIEANFRIKNQLANIY
ncbi:hypothetical protein VNO77_20505 [Canavalia gladiata]|uniref:Uncharacterized protein n=1 Tax=Canavalia gladiata TaxID=3824 RepID=A0AAN9LSW2_CANGL